MKKLKLVKVIAGVSLVISALVLNTIGASAEWRQDNNGWWYSEDNSCATGWRYIDGNWYYFYSDGYMAKDTAIDGYYLNSNGAWTDSLPIKYRMITNSLSNVIDMKIKYEDTNKNKTINDKELIGKIYDSITSTKTVTYINPNDLHSQLSDPIYSIQINYNDGKSDLIYSDATGEYIFRVLDNQGSWTGGENTELIELISM
jgi:hypothetical protein